jgi:hypothetical protein
MMPTQAYLHEAFAYDKETGDLVWRERPPHHFKNDQGRKTFNNQFAGKIAGSTSGNGYRHILVDGRRHKAHRIIWVMNRGEIPSGKEIDHADRNHANNRLENLRLATHAENMRNSPKRNDNQSGYKGIHLDKTSGKFFAQIRINGKQTFLGRFKTAAAAGAAYATAALETQGDFIHTSVVESLPEPLRAAVTHKAMSRPRRQRKPYVQLPLSLEAA